MRRNRRLNERFLPDPKAADDKLHVKGLPNGGLVRSYGSRASCCQWK